MSQVDDFSSLLEEALSEVEGAGLVAGAMEARSTCCAAYATSSEWLGEVGESLTELLRAYGASIPVSTKSKINACLAEVAKVWPKYGSS